MITSEYKLARKRYIGSSDMAAILGLSPYATAHDVFLEKTGRVEDDPGNENTELGNRFEGALVEFCCDQIGETWRRSDRRCLFTPMELCA